MRPKSTGTSPLLKFDRSPGKSLQKSENLVNSKERSNWEILFGKRTKKWKLHFDRILIATALCEGMKMVTPDPKIHDYPVPVIW